MKPGDEKVLVEGVRVQEGRGLPARWLDKIEIKSSDGHRVRAETVLVGTHVVHPHPGIDPALLPELVAAVVRVLSETDNGRAVDYGAAPAIQELARVYSAARMEADNA